MLINGRNPVIKAVKIDVERCDVIQDGSAVAVHRKQVAVASVLEMIRKKMQKSKGWGWLI